MSVTNVIVVFFTTEERGSVSKVVSGGPKRRSVGGDKCHDFDDADDSSSSSLDDGGMVSTRVSNAMVRALHSSTGRVAMVSINAVTGPSFIEGVFVSSLAVAAFAAAVTAPTP